WQGKTTATGTPDSTATVYSYSHTVTQSGDPATDTVTNPDLTQVVRTSNTDNTSPSFGAMTSSVTSNGSTTLSSSNFTYIQDSSGGLQVQSSSTAVDGGPTATTNYQYNGLGQVKKVIENGLGATALRTTRYTYVTDSNYLNSGLVGLVASVIVTDNTTGAD